MLREYWEILARYEISLPISKNIYISRMWAKRLKSIYSILQLAQRLFQSGKFLRTFGTVYSRLRAKYETTKFHHSSGLFE